MDVDYEVWAKSRDVGYERKAAVVKAKRLLSVIRDGNKYQSVFEVGCGNALVLDIISRSFNIKNVYGSDISGAMLNAAKKEIPKGIFFKGDIIRRWPSEFPKLLDLILYVDILEHVNDPAGLLKETAKKGNYFAFAVPLEKCLYLYFKMIFYRTELPGKNHSAGHLFAWNRSDILEMVGKDLDVICDKVYLPHSVNIDYAKRNSKSFFSKAYFSLESLFRKNFKSIYPYLFGAHIYIFAKRRSLN